MITLRPAASRGHADHGWLKAAHSFSFAGYRDPEHNRFGLLRVLNQDRVAPGEGFGTHGHENMEIVTYVLSGVLEHRDSMGNGSQMRHGEVQLMSAGSGVTHSEFNADTEDELHLLQMWVFPAVDGTPPRYEQKAFDPDELRGRLRLVVSPDGASGSLSISQDARLFAGLLDGPERIEQAQDAERMSWLHVARGALTLNGQRLGPGDGAAIRDEPALLLSDGEGAEFVLWELPRE